MCEQKYKTGELVALAEIGKETLRFYEKKGLLPKPSRTAGGYRIYTEKDLRRLLFIKNAKKLGLSLKEIGELLAIADGELVDCAEVRHIAQKRLDIINEQIDNLGKLKTILIDLINQCSKTNTINSCPIIDSLSKGVKK